MTVRNHTPRPTPRALAGTIALLAASIAPSIADAAATAAPAPAAGPAPSVGAANVAAAAPTFALKWTRVLNDNGKPIALSSPNVAQLDGRLAIVVGDRKGRVLAYHLDDGSPVAGWPFNAGTAVDSTPSVARLGAAHDTVFIGSGTSSSSFDGGYQAITSTGHSKWFVRETNPPTDPYPHNGVMSSLSVASLQGIPAIAGGSMGQMMYVLSATSGHSLAGFPWFQADDNFTTPALADIFGNGQTYIVEGGDSSPGISYGVTYKPGGHLRVLKPTGRLGYSRPSDGLVCQYNTDEVVQSSPAVGKFYGNNVVGAVFGTGYHYMKSTTNHLLAVSTRSCKLLWNKGLDGSTGSSPALADVLGNGQLQVIQGTNGHQTGKGSVWVLNGSNGATIWRKATTGPVIGSVVTADLRGTGHQDVLVPTTRGVNVFDGKTGASLGVFAAGYGFQSSPLVTSDPNGNIGITVAGYNGYNQGVIHHFEVVGSHGRAVNKPGAWPMFHHDKWLTGDASK